MNKQFVPLSYCPFCGETNVEYDDRFIHCLNKNCNMLVTFGFVDEDWKIQSARKFNARHQELPEYDPSKKKNDVYISRYMDINNVYHTLTIREVAK